MAEAKPPVSEVPSLLFLQPRGRLSSMAGKKLQRRGVRKNPKTAKKSRPKVFVGSSTEGLDVAYAIQENLQHDAEVTVWSQGVFDLSKTTLDSLSLQLSVSDFGMFVFMPDDAVRLRKKTYSAVRDNVVLEIGLFIGKLGVERTFMIVPDNVRDLRIPTDLIGVTPGKYDGARKDLEAALGPVCNQVRKAIRKLKFFNRPKTRRRAASHTVPKALVIHSAMYGARGHRVDVKDAILAELRKGNRNIFVGNQLGGDPTPNVRKDLRLEFSYRGAKHDVTIREGRSLSFAE